MRFPLSLPGLNDALAKDLGNTSLQALIDIESIAAGSELSARFVRLVLGFQDVHIDNLVEHLGAILLDVLQDLFMVLLDDETEIARVLVDRVF